MLKKSLKPLKLCLLTHHEVKMLAESGHPGHGRLCAPRPAAQPVLGGRVMSVPTKCRASQTKREAQDTQRRIRQGAVAEQSNERDADHQYGQEGGRTGCLQRNLQVLEKVHLDLRQLRAEVWRASIFQIELHLQLANDPRDVGAARAAVGEVPAPVRSHQRPGELGHQPVDVSGQVSEVAFMNSDGLLQRRLSGRVDLPPKYSEAAEGSYPVDPPGTKRRNKAAIDGACVGCHCGGHRSLSVNGKQHLVDHPTSYVAGAPAP